MKHQMIINKALIGCLLVFFSLGLSAQVDLQSGLQAWYPFNGNADDESGNTHHATTYNDPQLTADRFGNENSAYLFDGKNDYMDTRISFDYEYKTVSVWFYANQINNGSYSIVNQDANTLQYGLAGLHIVNGNIVCYPGGSVNGLTTPATANEWTHAVYIRNGSSTSIYLNGVLAFTGASGTVGSSYNPYINTVIGTTRTRTSNFFDGKIDDIRIYNRALNTAEIQALFTETVTQPASVVTSSFDSEDNISNVYSTVLTPSAGALVSTLADKVDMLNQVCAAVSWTYEGKPYLEMGLLKFDLSSLPANAKVESAVVSLKGAQHDPAGHSNASRLYMMSNDWTQGIATGELVYNDKYFAVIDETTSGEVTDENRNVDIKNLVEKWLGGYPNHGMLMKLDDEEPYSVMRFHSEDATSDLQPKLLITYSLDQSVSVEWDPDLTKNILIDHPTLTRQDGGDWKGVAVSKNVLHAQQEGAIEFMVLNDVDDYIIGFSEGPDPSLFRAKVHIHPGEQNGTCDLIFTANEEAQLTGIQPYDVIRISKEKDENDYWGYKLYVNGSEFVAFPFEEQDLPAFYIDALIFNTGGRLYNIKLEAKGINYYVNDGSKEGDVWCTAVGSNDNDGLSPATPFLSIQQIPFDQLHPNDKILVDAGTYQDALLLIDKPDIGAAGQPVYIQGAGRGLSKVISSDGPAMFIEGSGNLDVSGLSMLTTVAEGDDMPLIEVSASWNIRISDCYIQKDAMTGKPMILIDGGQDISVEGNILISEGSDVSLLYANACSGLRVERNWMMGGIENVSLYDAAGACSNFAINRNFLISDGIGLNLVLTDENELSAGTVYNNSFYTTVHSVVTPYNWALNNIGFANNIVSSQNGYGLYVGDFDQANGFFNHCSNNLFGVNTREQYAYLGVELTFEDYLNVVSSINENYGQGSLVADPLFVSAEAGNLNVLSASDANTDGYQHEAFDKRIDINGLLIEGPYRIGASSQPIDPNSSDVFMDVKKKMDGGYFLLTSRYLRIKYREEYSVDKHSDITYRIYNGNHQIIAEFDSQNVSTHVVKRSYGTNYIEVDVCDYALDTFNVLEMENDKGEKWYVKFKKPGYLSIISGCRPDDMIYNQNPIPSPTSN